LIVKVGTAKNPMGLPETILPAIGIGLCLLAMCQVALWSSQSLGFRKLGRQQFSENAKRFRAQIRDPLGDNSSDMTTATWAGFRNFRVDSLVKETDTCTSVYLVPEDGKPIPHFHPGQHLTFRFTIPGQAKPVVRCYSLSDGPGKAYYRISVKIASPPHDRDELPPGKASSYINQLMQVGQIVPVKAPAGHFFLNEESNKPVVLLAGGVGITPMVSMLDRLIATQSQRLILLAYGINHSADHAFKQLLAAISEQHPNVHLLNCYSRPQATDHAGVDYHLDGRVSTDLLQQVLPDPDCEFYLCGPPPFMKSLYEGLLEWGVAESDIRYEAFGPASIGKRPSKSADVPCPAPAAEPVAIKFAVSDATAVWDGSHESLLEFAEASGIPVDSGCRAGSCGSCSVEVIAGKIEYSDGQKPNCEPGHCLTCIARPNGPVELGA
jgi:ferredoxin-NADP reductase